MTEPSVGVPTGDKTCPRCAESVKAIAKVCRYCGFRFGVDAAPAPLTEPWPAWEASSSVLHQPPVRSVLGPDSIGPTSESASLGASGAVATAITVAVPMKVCPACAEEVRAASLVCRFCGYAFDPAFARANPKFVHPTTTSAGAPVKVRKKGLAGSLLFRVLFPILILAAIAVFLSLYLGNALNKLKQQSAPKSPKPSPTVQVSGTPLALARSVQVGSLTLIFPA